VTDPHFELRTKRGLVTNGYNIFLSDWFSQPADPASEERLWYMCYLQSERGRVGLQRDRDAFSGFVWRQSSPAWDFSDADFSQSALAFQNPDFVEVVLHSYRHRITMAPGDFDLADIEEFLAGGPPITVATISIDGTLHGVMPHGTESHRSRFAGPYEHRTAAAGHNIPQEVPFEFGRAILDLHDQFG
jgi:hypothetical protein